MFTEIFTWIIVIVAFVVHIAYLIRIYFEGRTYRKSNQELECEILLLKSRLSNKQSFIDYLLEQNSELDERLYAADENYRAEQDALEDFNNN